MSFFAASRWIIDIILFFVLKDYLRAAPKWIKWLVWSLFGATVGVEIYFTYWYNFVLGRVPNDWLTAYFGGIVLCIYAVKALFITIRLLEIAFRAITYQTH